jgi:uncharacterized membrane protein
VGQIVGFYRLGDILSPIRGFLYGEGSFSAIHFPLSEATSANDIDNFGHIVGSFQFSRFAGDRHGFLFDGTDYFLIDMPAALWTTANGINDEGEIVGTYVDVSGIEHGYLLTPVPEPHTAMQLAIGMCVVVLSMSGFGHGAFARYRPRSPV